MQVGLMAPQGWKGEYDGRDPADAWANTVELARQAEALGFESLWVFDHFHTVPEPTDEITFESFSSLAALAMVTSRMRIGHMVICTAFRNPALTAKLASTIDVISGGRFELGIGAGWYEHECSRTATGSRPWGSGSGSWATTSRSSRGCSGLDARRSRVNTPRSTGRSTSRRASSGTSR
jgi:alkanesulfonate monooxygenase SsuD/methylene tetrahydromethanopterin reductase-like flavin-dependent oxidoreductase (luciferase family)